MTFSFKKLAAAMCTAAILASPLSAIAQSATFSDSQLQSFAVAVVAINEIAEKWQPQIQAAQSEDQAAEMLQQVDVEMRQAIESTDGIGVEDYQNIMVAAQSDEALKGQIDTLMQEVAPQ